MNSDREREYIVQSLRLAISKPVLSDEQLNKLVCIHEETFRWNDRIKLVSTPREAFAERHLLDSLYAASAVPASAATLVDVGSGAGLPGLVIAVVFPQLRVTLLEPIRKKHAFLRHVRRLLGLDNVRALAERDESHRERNYDVAISRATWSPTRWLSRGSLLVRPGGLVIAMEGAELSALPVGAVRHPYRLADGRCRALLLWHAPHDPLEPG